MNSKSENHEDILSDADRLAVIDALDLMDSDVEEALDRLTRLAAKLVPAPIALVSIVDDKRQFFKSAVGLSEPWASRRETALSHSFCQYVVSSGEPLIVEDAHLSPLLQDNLAIPDLGIVSYLGMPLTLKNGMTLGSFCVIDNEAREWSKQDIEIVYELAKSIITEIELRHELLKQQVIEQKLRIAEEQYRTVVTAMSEGVFLQDGSGKVLTNNRSAEKILGVKPGSLLNLNPTSLSIKVVHEDGTTMQLNELPHMVALRTCKAQTNVIVGVYRSTGELQWLSVNSQPLVLKNETSPKHVVTTFSDITELKAAQEHTFMLAIEDERRQILSKFIQDAFHEFFTPLSIIQTSKDLLLKHSDKMTKERQEQALHNIDKQVNRLTTLIDDMMLMWKLDQGYINQKSTVTLDNIITDIKHKLTGFNASVLYDLDPQAAVLKLSIDQDLMVIAICNVLKNATGFVAQGSIPHITIQTHHDNTAVYIRVQDEGIGMNETQIENAFKRFYRGDVAHTTPGFGLGLPITKKIIEVHNGTLVINSTPGQGTSVSIGLPII